MSAMPHPFAMLHVLSILFVALLHLHLHALLSCDAGDTISTNQAFTSNDKLISSNGKFALGFFHTGSESSNTTNNWYLGIWFKVPKLIPVWVANRQSPIIDPTMTELTLYLDGNLVILDKVTKSRIWSTQIGNKAKGNSTTAVLLNNGNLVLRESSNMSSMLWQSFNYPADALLPGAKAGRNKVSGLQYSLTSKRNMLDLAPGVYCSEVDPTGVPQFISKLCNSSIVYWSSGAWNGRYFSSLPHMSGEIEREKLFYYKFVDNDEEEYSTYTVRNDTLIIFSLFDISGQFKQMIWLESAQDWLAVDTQPKAQCDVYAVCGPFTICSDNMFPLCTCMKGFSIVLQTSWELGDRTSGCVRNYELDCESKQRGMTSSTDKFYMTSGVRLPSNANIIEAAVNSDECAQAYLSQCSCTAYSYASRCSVWQNGLLNVVNEQQSGSSSNANEEIIYIRVSTKEMQGSRHNNMRRTTICASIAAAFGMSSAIILLLLLFLRNKRKTFGSIFNNLQGDGGGIIHLTYSNLCCATNFF
jgi:hypothetical protein